MSDEITKAMKSLALKFRKPVPDALIAEARKKNNHATADYKRRLKEYTDDVMNGVAARMPPRFRDTDLSDLKRNKGNADAIKEANIFIADFPERAKAGRGLLFTGQAGRGKTVLAVAVVREIIKMRSPVRKLKYTAYPTGIHKEAISTDNPGMRVTPYFRTCKRYIESRLGDGGRSALTEITARDESPILIIDDFGAGVSGEWAQDQLYDLIDYWYTSMMPVIITTNYGKDDLISRCGDRIVSRLHEMCEFAGFTNSDWRRE